MQLLDCRGLACPQPVVLCRDLIAQPAATEFQIMVDNQAAVHNVSTYLGGKGWEVETLTSDGGEWLLAARRQGQAADPREACACKVETALGKTLVFIPTESMGQGDDDLGAKLMLNFLATLPELGGELWRIVLVNGGVKLAVDGPCLEKLQTLERAGVSILVCGTCLDHYGLLEQKQVGDTTNMLDIVTSLQLAEKVIRL